MHIAGDAGMEFRTQFIGAIGGQGPGFGDFCQRHVRIIAINCRRTGIDHRHRAIRAGRAGGIQHGDAAGQIDLVHRHPILVRALHGCNGRQMKASFDARHGAAHGGRVRNIAQHQLDTVQRQVFALAGGQVIQHADPIAAGEQSIDQMRADKSASAGHQIESHPRNPCSSSPGVPGRRPIVVSAPEWCVCDTGSMPGFQGLWVSGRHRGGACTDCRAPRLVTAGRFGV